MEFDKDKLATILSRNWWVLLLRGMVAIPFGVLTWLQPGISLASLVLLFGAYSMADGIRGPGRPSPVARSGITGGSCCSRAWWGSASAC